MSIPQQQDMIGRFAQHKVAANLLMFIMLLAGIIGLSRLNTQFLPTFTLDYITVRVVWPGATAEDIARSVTTPLEQELKNLDFVKEMRSVSSRGFSTIILEYDEGSDMGLALDQVKEFVGLVRNLPSEAEEPKVTKVVRNEDVATLILTTNNSLDELRPLAYQFERELLAKGIAKVDFTGLPEQEIAIQIPSHSIERLKLSLPQIGRLIKDQSQDIPAGTSGKNEVARELRSLEQRRTDKGFQALAILTSKNTQKLTLDDIADIDQRSKDNQVEVFYKGNPAILMKIMRTENADTLKAAEILHQWLDSAKPRLSPGTELHAFNEAYVLVEERIDLLLKNGLGGLMLVIGILFIFLNGRVAFWVAWGIPVSFMGTLAVLYLAGGSINMVSLFALIMALGIIVDDAIVVGEDALTHYTTGESSLQAAEGGARRMFIPVVSSSLTTIAAFLPLMMVSGIIGNILSAIPLVIICVIIASLIESFLILPGHLRHSFHNSHHKAPGPFRVKLDDAFTRFRDLRFRPLVTTAMENRLTTVLLAICALALAISLIASGRIQFTFFPSPDNKVLIASVKFAAGTPPEKVRAFGLEMEKQLQNTNQALKSDTDILMHSVLRINTATFDGGMNYSSGDQYASVQAELTSPDLREVTNTEFVNAWESAMNMPDGVEQLSVTSPKGGSPGKDIDIFLSGIPPTELKAAAEEVSDKLSRYTGISNVQDDLPYGKQQFIYDLTPLGNALGITVSDVGNQLRAAFDGQLIQIFYDNNEEVEVRVILPDEERDSYATLETFPIITPNGSSAPLSNIVNLTSRKGLELLRHTDGHLGIHITAEVDTTVNNANIILEEMQGSFFPELSARYGLSVDLKGKAEEQRETGSDMKNGALIALALIYLILAWVFGSYTWPFAIMVAIPFGLTGAVFGHALLNIDLTILSLFGFFGLSGIVINDAIILVTFYQELRSKGLAIKQAVIDAACLRLRAVMLTSLTTIAGLTPLLFETSLQAQFLIPMAVSISFGLAFATLLVLIVIPVILSLIEDGKIIFHRHFLSKSDI
ncbi:efflux RND transporter permease subunit [Alkalimarinus alittae]|uniref:Efflux RND transporter permease subunit n=1 Tax=Alkalimarinus alittae TaxID=2961619 RepID=A0ABY6N0B6_9ALTE|nr:efflux RND transporter permease subunit [Alkalimarinus alittae]UZE95434.1 efflux RND transporter permease subunit [Alkalimarinus alittae]